MGKVRDLIVSRIGNMRSPLPDYGECHPLYIPGVKFFGCILQTYTHPNGYAHLVGMEMVGVRLLSTYATSFM
jgi:hypothetical protein